MLAARKLHESLVEIVKKIGERGGHPPPPLALSPRPTSPQFRIFFLDPLASLHMGLRIIYNACSAVRLCQLVWQ